MRRSRKFCGQPPKQAEGTGRFMKLVTVPAVRIFSDDPPRSCIYSRRWFHFKFLRLNIGPEHRNSDQTCRFGMKKVRWAVSGSSAIRRSSSDRSLLLRTQRKKHALVRRKSLDGKRALV